METTSTVTAPEATQDLEATFARLIAQIDEIREQMKADDISIRQSDAEYAVLKAESQTLRAQTESILANLRRLL